MTGVTVRTYESGDHAKVCQMFYDGMVENWWPAYRRVLTGACPRPAIIQALVLALLLTYFPLTTCLVVELLLQLFLISMFYYCYWDYARTHLATDMKDAAMVSWTGRGEEAGFYVAELEGRVIGTIAYQRKSSGELEVFRLSVDQGGRGRRAPGAGSSWRLRATRRPPSGSTPGLAGPRRLERFLFPDTSSTVSKSSCFQRRLRR